MQYYRSDLEPNIWVTTPSVPFHESCKTKSHIKKSENSAAKSSVSATERELFPALFLPGTAVPNLMPQYVEWPLGILLPRRTAIPERFGD